jgi:hypothetical protein
LSFNDAGRIVLVFKLSGNGLVPFWYFFAGAASALDEAPKVAAANAPTLVAV